MAKAEFQHAMIDGRNSQALTHAVPHHHPPCELPSLVEHPAVAAEALGFITKRILAIKALVADMIWMHLAITRDVCCMHQGLTMRPAPHHHPPSRQASLSPVIIAEALGYHSKPSPGHSSDRPPVWLLPTHHARSTHDVCSQASLVPLLETYYSCRSTLICMKHHPCRILLLCARGILRQHNTWWERRSETNYYSPTHIETRHSSLSPQHIYVHILHRLPTTDLQPWI